MKNNEERRHYIFEHWKYLSDNIRELNTIFQNEMPITNEMIKQWLDQCNIIHKNYVRLTQGSLKFLKELRDKSNE